MARVSDVPRKFDFDLEAYVRRVRTGPCFICRIVAGDPELPAHVILHDDRHIAFLTHRPLLRGYLLVAPVDHREDVVGDFTLEEYLALQATVHRLGRAVSRVVETERLYLLSLGSHQGNSHVHWHVAPLPPVVPYDQQQFAALMVERAGYLDLSEESQAALAQEIAAVLADSD